MNGFQRQNKELGISEEIFLVDAPEPAADGQMPGIDLTQKATGSQAATIIDSLAEEDTDPKVQAIGGFIGEAAVLMEPITGMINKIAGRPGALGKQGARLRSMLLELDQFICVSANIQTVDAEVISTFIKGFQGHATGLMKFIWNILDTSYDLDPEDQQGLITAQAYIDELNQKALVLKKTNVPGVWEELRSPVINILKIPKGLRICVVDDEQDILDDTASMIDEAGGIAHKAMNLRQLSALGGQHVDVILLDHSLQETKGYEVLHRIKMLFPDAIVIVHTSEAKSLLAEEENPYGDHPIVGKHDWAGINSVLEEKLSQAA